MDQKRRKIRLLLADDHTVVRQGLRLILSQHEDLEVVAEAADGEEAVQQGLQLRPDVAVIDIAMPRLNGVEATRQLRQQCPECNIVILSMHKDAAYVRETLRVGAKGYLLKDTLGSELVKAIRAAAAGDGYISPAVSATVLADYQRHVTDPLDAITPRERQILQMLAEGRTAKEIAAELEISVYTVDAHRGRIMRKLQLRSIGELVRLAIQRGLIPLSDTTG